MGENVENTIYGYHGVKDFKEQLNLGMRIEKCIFSPGCFLCKKSKFGQHYIPKVGHPCLVGSF